MWGPSCTRGPRSRSGPIPGELIPITLFIVAGMVGMTFTPVGRALARRLAGGAPDPELEREVQALRDEVAELREDGQALRRELAEAHERLDFAERVIAQTKDRGALPGAR